MFRWFFGIPLGHVRLLESGFVLLLFPGPPGGGGAVYDTCGFMTAPEVVADGMDVVFK